MLPLGCIKLDPPCPRSAGIVVILQETLSMYFGPACNQGVLGTNTFCNKLPAGHIDGSIPTNLSVGSGGGAST